MLLTGPEIQQLAADSKLKIDPFDPKHVGANSYDVTLGPALKVYKAQLEWAAFEANNAFASREICISTAVEVQRDGGRPELRGDFILDPEGENETIEIEISEVYGLILMPGLTYIGSSVEWTETPYPYAPMLEGRSTWGRLGVCVHHTAGVGDVGFRGNWVLEISVQSPVRVRRNQRIAQLLFHRVEGAEQCYHGRYQDQKGSIAARPFTDPSSGEPRASD